MIAEHDVRRTANRKQVQAKESRPSTGDGLLIARLGRMGYQEAWNLQKQVAEARRQDRIPDVLLLVEHPHTFTLGRRGRSENILLTARQLQRRRIALYEVDRGGDVTYHGPGQLVGYPILKLPAGRLDYVRYIRAVERALLAVVQQLGIAADLAAGYSGVWVGDKKICAVGVKVDAHGVTSHGFALNVNTDLTYFGHIIPCGISDKGVTSLDVVLGRHVSMRRVADIASHCLAATFELPRMSGGRRRLQSLLDRPECVPIA